MARIPEEVINDLRNQVDIVDVISEYLPLTKRGSNYMASCPFHEDRNPSFSVSQTKQIYKCFSCGRGGNVFGFIQEMEGLSFPEAVAKVAELNHTPLSAEYLTPSQPVDAKKQRLLDLHQQVMDFYHYYLMNTVNGSQAYDYLLARALSEESLETFMLGLAPDKSQVLVDLLQQSGYQDDELIESGIFYQTDQGDLLDRFRGRIIFPLRDQQGRPVAFSGRIYQEHSSQSAKYLNSPETRLFDKSSLLYNLDLARQPIRQQQQALIAEGFMDVIALYQAGFQQTVATMGTALTSYHLQVLAKLSPELIFIFDGDEAGLKATKRAFDQSRGMTGTVFKAVNLPDKLDPDSYIKERGAEKFQLLLNQANPSYEFMQHYLAQQYNLQDPSDLSRYIEDLMLEIARIESPIERQLRAKELQHRYHLDETLVDQQIALNRQVISRQEPAIASQPYPNHPAEEGSVPALPPLDQVDNVLTSSLRGMEIRSKRAFQSEKLLLFQLLYYSQAWKYVEDMEDDLILYHELAQRTYYELSSHYYEQGYPLPMIAIIDTIQDSDIHNLLTTIMYENEDLGYKQQIMEDCIQCIKEEFIQQEINELRAKAADLDKQQKTSEFMEVMTDIMRLTRQIK